MSNRVSFRSRTVGVPPIPFAGYGVPTNPAKGFFLWDQRVGFMEGVVYTEAGLGPDNSCGPGKRFNMEVTGVGFKDKLDKIFEIFYRVRDAHFMSGRLSSTYIQSWVFEPPLAYDQTTDVYDSPIQIPTNAPPGSGMPAYNTEERYTKRGFPHDKEASAISIGPYSSFSPPNIGSAESCVTGFSLYASHHTDYWFGLLGSVTTYDPYTCNFVGGSYMTVDVRSTIAYVPGNDGFFSSDTRFFLNIEVFAAGTFNYVGLVSQEAPGFSPICQYKMELSSSILSMPLWGYIGSQEPGYSYGEDFVHRAVKWFEYETSTGNPMWSEYAGLYLGEV